MTGKRSGIGLEPRTSGLLGQVGPMIKVVRPLGDQAVPTFPLSYIQTRIREGSRGPGVPGGASRMMDDGDAPRGTVEGGLHTTRREAMPYVLHM
jgi:hypothetical protein